MESCQPANKGKSALLALAVPEWGTSYSPHDPVLGYEI